MQPFVIVGKAQEVFDLIALKSKQEQARLELEATLKQAAEIVKKGEQDHGNAASNIK